MRPSNVWYKALLLVAVAGIAAASRVGAATASVVSSRVAIAVAPRGGGATSHIALSSATVVSGASAHGNLVVVNDTGRPIHWACAYLEVQLTNPRWPLEVHPTPCSLHGKTLRVGTTRLGFTLWASRGVCAPSCTSRPLPPGTYQTQILSGPPVAHPAAITVRVVARSRSATSG